MASVVTEYNRGYHLERYHRMRQADIARLGGACAGCGATEDLEFDHVDPATKTFNVSKLWGVAAAVRQAELDKCQLLCQPCHKEKSDREQATRQHGTPAMYRRGKCRCTACVVANSEYMKRFEQRPRRTCSICGRRSRTCVESGNGGWACNTCT